MNGFLLHVTWPGWAGFTKQVAQLDRKPVIAFDCGVDDQLIEENRAFHRHLEAIGPSHTYHEHTGGHTWDYWDLHVAEALEQHARVLGLRQAD
jgi:S-formylglutathione hydrolase FrmB